MELISVATLHSGQTPQSCLHTDSYCHMLAGEGFGVDAARAAVETVYQIQNNVSVYDGVTLEDNVFCGPSMVFTNVYNPRSAVSRKHAYRHTLVRRGATLGANCTIVCGVTICQHAFMGAGAVITKDTLPYALMAGVPARQIGWMSAHGERLQLPLAGSGEAVCSASGQVYRLDNGQVELE